MFFVLFGFVMWSCSSERSQMIDIEEFVEETDSAILQPLKTRAFNAGQNGSHNDTFVVVLHTQDVLRHMRFDKKLQAMGPNYKEAFVEDVFKEYERDLLFGMIENRILQQFGYQFHPGGAVWFLPKDKEPKNQEDFERNFKKPIETRRSIAHYLVVKIQRYWHHKVHHNHSTDEVG